MAQAKLAEFLKEHRERVIPSDDANRKLWMPMRMPSTRDYFSVISRMGVAVGVAVGVGLGGTVAVAVALGPTVAVGVNVAVAVGVGVGVGVTPGTMKA